MVKLLLQAGVPIDVPDIFETPTHYYPLHYVAMREEVETTYECLELLKSYGARFDIRDPKYGRTPLHTASLFGNAIAVEWLIQEACHALPVGEALAFINQPEQGPFQRNTTLHNAVYGGHWAVVETLLNKGADISACNYTGNTPLMELLCGPMSVDSKVHGLLLFYQREGSYHLTQNNLETLKQCTRPPFEEEILPALLKLKAEYPQLMHLALNTSEEPPHGALLFSQSLATTSPLTPKATNIPVARYDGGF